MILTVLGSGTSGGVPMIGCSCPVCTSTHPKDQRLRSSIMLEENGTTIVVDAGPDFRQQMLREKVQQLDAILLTHSHKDHTAGFDEVRAFNYFQKRPMDVYLSDASAEALKKEYHYIFENKWYPGLPELQLHSISSKPFQVGNFDIRPIEVMHYKMPVLGFRMKDFAYITDANYIEESEKRKLQGLDMLIINALRKEAHISHYSLPEALALISELQPKRAYITHISHQMGLHNAVSATLPDQVFLAFDGLKLDL